MRIVPDISELGSTNAHDPTLCGGHISMLAAEKVLVAVPYESHDEETVVLFTTRLLV